MHLNNEVLTFKLCFNLGEFVIYRSSINQLFFKVDSVAFLVGVWKLFGIIHRVFVEKYSKLTCMVMNYWFSQADIFN